MFFAIVAQPPTLSPVLANCRSGCSLEILARQDAARYLLEKNMDSKVQYLVASFKTETNKDHKFTNHKLFITNSSHKSSQIIKRSMD